MGYKRRITIKAVVVTLLKGYGIRVTDMTHYLKEEIGDILEYERLEPSHREAHWGSGEMSSDLK